MTAKRAGDRRRGQAATAARRDARANTQATTRATSQESRERRPRRLHPFPVVCLAAVWVLLWGDLSVANVLAGLLLGSTVLLVFPLPTVVAGLHIRVWPMVVLLVRFQADLVIASFQVAWQSVRPGPPPPSAVFTATLRSEDELFQTLTAELISLVPGSLVIDLDSPSRTLKIHALGISSPEGVEQMRAGIAVLEGRVLRAFSADGTGARGASVEQKGRAR